MNNLDSALNKLKTQLVDGIYGALCNALRTTPIADLYKGTMPGKVTRVGARAPKTKAVSIQIGKYLVPIKQLPPQGDKPGQFVATIAGVTIRRSRHRDLIAALRKRAA